MIPLLDRFKPVFDKYGLDLLIAQVVERLSEDELLNYARQFDGTICGDDLYTSKVLEECSPRLKVISKWGTGVDSIDSEACHRLNIKLMRTPNAFTIPVADSVMGYILAFARRLPWMDTDMKEGKWEKLPGRALSECTLGVIGVGNIGKAALRRARTFGMHLIGNDIVEIDPAFIKEINLEMTDLKSLLTRSDFVSVNCDLNPGSRHLMNADTLAWMKPGGVLINTARGSIMNEKDLIAALRRNQLAGAALDVFESEPLPLASPLRSMPNVMLAPHNSNSSPAAWEFVHRNTIKNLVEGLGLTYE